MEKRYLPSIDNIHEVEYQERLDPKTRLGSASEQSDDCGVDDNGPSELEWYSPCMEIVVHPRHATFSEDEAELLEITVPH